MLRYNLHFLALTGVSNPEHLSVSLSGGAVQLSQVQITQVKNKS